VMAGFALALRPGWRARGLGLFLLFLAAAVRDSAALALIPLLVFACGAWEFRRRRTALLAAAGVWLALIGGSTLLNRAVTRVHYHPWYRTVAVMDLTGTICNAGPMSDAELGELLAGTGRIPIRGIQDRLCALYTPRVWFPLVQSDAAYWTDPPTKQERLARRDAWWQLVRDHPGAYLAHRWAVMAEVLGLTDEEPWQPVCQSFQANTQHAASLHHNERPSRIQQGLGAVFVALGHTILFRPWLYALLALCWLGYACVRRDGLLATIVGSGLLYEASYFVTASAPDFRYSHWMIVCSCIGGVLVFADRYRRRKQAVRTRR